MTAVHTNYAACPRCGRRVGEMKPGKPSGHKVNHPYKWAESGRPARENPWCMPGNPTSPFQPPDPTRPREWPYHVTVQLSLSTHLNSPNLALKGYRVPAETLADVEGFLRSLRTLIDELTGGGLSK